jgi:hypothetical protein
MLRIFERRILIRIYDSIKEMICGDQGIGIVKVIKVRGFRWRGQLLVMQEQNPCRSQLHINRGHSTSKQTCYQVAGLN